MIVILLPALALALLAAFATAPLGDEYMQFHAALARPALGDFLAQIRHNPHHLLLDPLSTWLAARVAGSPAWLRAPSLLWGAAALAGLNRLAGGGRRGLFAAALLAVSAMHAEWTARADFYAAACALAVWQTVLLLALEERPQRRAPYAVLAAVFLHAHPYAVLVAGLHGLRLAAARRREALRAWASAWAAAGLSFLPWFLWSTKAALDRDALAFSDAGPGLARFLLEVPLRLAAASEAAPAAAGGALLLQWSLALALAGLWLYSRLPGADRPESAALSAARLITPAGLALVVATDLFFRMYLAPRQLIWILPFYLLEAAAGFERLAARLPRAATAGLGAALLAGLLAARLGALKAEAAAGISMSRVIVAVKAGCRDGDVLRFDDGLTAHAFLYWFDREAFARAPFREIPEGLRARCADGSAAVVAAGASASGPEWSFSGTWDEFTVSPALRGRR